MICADAGVLPIRLPKAEVAKLKCIPTPGHTSTSCKLLPDDQVAFYRIAQETMNTVAKHDEANHINMALHCDEESVCVKIRDEGVELYAKLQPDVVLMNPKCRRWMVLRRHTKYATSSQERRHDDSNYQASGTS